MIFILRSLPRSPTLLVHQRVLVGYLPGCLVSAGREARSRYEVECDPAIGGGSVVNKHTLFETSAALAAEPSRHFDLVGALGEEG